MIGCPLITVLREVQQLFDFIHILPIMSGSNVFVYSCNKVCLICKWLLWFVFNVSFLSLSLCLSVCLSLFLSLSVSLSFFLSLSVCLSLSLFLWVPVHKKAKKPLNKQTKKWQQREGKKSVCLSHLWSCFPYPWSCFFLLPLRFFLFFLGSFMLGPWQTSDCWSDTIKWFFIHPTPWKEVFFNSQCQFDLNMSSKCWGNLLCTLPILSDVFPMVL